MNWNPFIKAPRGGRGFVGVGVGVVGRVGGMDGGGDVRFEVVGAVGVDTGVSVATAGVVSWVGGNVTGAFRLQPSSSVSTKIRANEIPCFMITAII